VPLFCWYCSYANFVIIIAKSYVLIGRRHSLRPVGEEEMQIN